MRVTGDEVFVEVGFSHPTFLRILHHLGDGALGDDRHVDEWLKTLAWIQMQRDIGHFEVEAIAELPEETRTNIELYRQHFEQKEGDDKFVFGDSINKFVEISSGELIDMNDLGDDE